MIFDLAESSPYRAYVYGKLTLAGLRDTRVSAARWLDAVYAILMECPDERLRKMQDQLVLLTARLRPDRASWGLTPEQVEMSNRISGQRVPR